MNYLKKKINKEKRKNRAHDDDDAFDFIPAVPLHPDELARKQREEEALFNGLSEEEKAALLEERARKEREKKEEEENKKQSSEAWKFFEQLNQRVTDTVIKTDDLIEKLKDSTTAADLTKAADVELGFASPEEEEPLEKGPQYKKGSWIGFEERKSNAPKVSSSATTPSAEVPKHEITGLVPDHAPVPVEVSRTADDFDFGSAFDSNDGSKFDTSAFGAESSAEDIAIPPEEDDPFDTSYVAPVLGLTAEEEEEKKRKEINNNKRAAKKAKEVPKKVEPVVVPKSTRKIEIKSVARPKPKVDPRQAYEEKVEQLVKSPENQAPPPQQPLQRKESVPKEAPKVEANQTRKPSLTRRESITESVGSVVSVFKRGSIDIFNKLSETVTTAAATVATVPQTVQKQEPVANSDPAPKPEIPTPMATAATEQPPAMTAKSPEEMDASEDIEGGGDGDFDPEVTNLYLQRKKEINSTKYGSNVSLASILSNPFLNEDFDEGADPTAITPEPANDVTSTSGRKSSQGLVRRMSTNPFEDEGADDVPVDPGAASIAALTAEFVSAVEVEKVPDTSKPPKPEAPKISEAPKNNPGHSNLNNNPSSTSNNPGHNNPGHNNPNPASNNPGPPPPKPPAPSPVNVTTEEAAEEESGSNPAFDPFQTIHDDNTHPDDHSTTNPTTTTIQSSSLAPPPVPAYPSDVSDNEEEEDKVVPVLEKRGDPRSGSVSGVVKDMPTRKMSMEVVSMSRKVSLERKMSLPRKISISSKPFDPFQRVEDSPSDETADKADDVERLSLTAQLGDGDRTTIASNDSQLTPEGRDDGDESSFTNPDDASKSNLDAYKDEAFEPVVPEYDDPFDTSIYSFEPVKDAVKVTDEKTFDAFAAKFDSVPTTAASTGAVDAFSSPLPTRKVTQSEVAAGFGETPAFGASDPFAAAPQKIVVRKRPPKPVKKKDAFADKDQESSSSSSDDETENLKFVIKARVNTDGIKPTPPGMLPLLPPPPRTPVKARQAENYDPTVEMNLKKRVSVSGKGQDEEKEEDDEEEEDVEPPVLGEKPAYKRDSQESPSTPLFDDDVSQPLEEFPKRYDGDGWEMYIRYPAKKKLTGNRFWKKIFVRVSENSIVQLYNKIGDPDPFQELPLQPSYSCSEISAQQFDQFGKIFTLKLMYIFYKERVGVRKGQIAKVLGGQVTSLGSFAKLGMPLDHAPQETELIKIGSNNYNDMVMFNQVIEEALFRLPLHRDRALTYKTEEIQITVQDDYYVEVNKIGSIQKQLARVRIFFIAFINGMPGVEIGVNDMTRQGKEIVGRYDIIPVVTEEWIRIEDYEFHSCVMVEEFEKTQTIKLIPPDATLFELMRFRVRPPRNRELPLQVTCNMYITKTKVELRCEILVPGCVSRKHGQIPCEDIQIRIHIPECWIYAFRTEKHMRFGSVKSANRRTGKIKGLERFLGAATSGNLEQQLMESTAGVAKYEHHHHCLVWRIPRLPKEGHGAYTQQLLNVNLPLTNFDQVPESYYEYVHVEFTMPSTTVSHAVVRSVSVTSDEPPEKFVRNVSKHEYKIQMGIHHDYEQTNDFVLAASAPNRPPPPSAAKPDAKKVVEEEDEDSDESE